MEDKIKELLKEKLVDKDYSTSQLDLVSLFGFTTEERKKSEDFINGIVERNVMPSVKRIFYNLKDNLESGNLEDLDLSKGLEMDVKLKMVDDILLPLMKELPIGLLLAASINCFADKLKGNILGSIEMSVLGTLQNCMREAGNTRAADMIKHVMQQKLEELSEDRNIDVRVSDSDGNDVSSSNEIINNFKNSKPTIEDRKDSDDNDFLNHISKN